MGTEDREGESWKTEEQMVGRVQGDDWWTVHTPGTNPVIVEKYPSRFQQEGKQLPAVKD